MYVQELARRLQQQEVASRQKMKQQRAQSLDQPAPTLPGEDAASLVSSTLTYMYVYMYCFCVITGAGQTSTERRSCETPSVEATEASPTESDE